MAFNEKHNLNGILTTGMNMKYSRVLARGGFTIVELVIIIVIIGILVTISAAGYTGVQKNARDKALQSDIAAVVSAETNYSIHNNGMPKAWFSGSGVDSDLAFTPSKGNTIDVVTAGSSFCVRAYNPASNKDAITNSFSQGSTPEACELIDASTAAGGTGGKVVGWWKLNGNAIDSSGQGHDGTVNGATSTTGQDTTANGAYNFSSTAVQSINTNYSFPLNKLSVSMWVKWSGASVASYATLISNTRDCCSTYNGLQVHVERSTSMIGTRLWYGSSFSSMSYSSLPVGTWSHVALTYDGQKSVLYLNGQQVKTTALTQTLGAPAYNMFIGRGGWANGYSFGGDIDDVRIYDYGLSATTVKAIYDRGAL